MFPGELIVDEREGYYGAPRTMYRVKLIDRSVLEERFEEHLKTGRGQRDGKVRGKSGDDFERHIDRISAYNSAVDQCSRSSAGAWAPSKTGRQAPRDTPS